MDVVAFCFLPTKVCAVIKTVYYRALADTRKKFNGVCRLIRQGLVRAYNNYCLYTTAGSI